MRARTLSVWRVKSLELAVAVTVLSLASASQSQENAARLKKPPLILGGITLGTRLGATVTAPPKTRLERNRLFIAHGNPIAVMIPLKVDGAMPPEQRPPDDKTTLLVQQKASELPDWIAPVSIQLDALHVEWLYRQKTSAMGFVIDRLGFVDAIAVAGTRTGKTTRLESARGVVDLGDDARKVIFHFGFPDQVEEVAQGQDKPRIFQYHYQPGPDLPGIVVFTIRNNRVARIYTVFAP